jgi:hypothetical protein
VGRKSRIVALLALAVAGSAVAGFALYSFSGREITPRDSGVGSSTPPSGSLVLTWIRSGESYRIRKSCGLIRVRGRPVAIDIAEGGKPLTCGVARAVMSRYFARRFVRYGTVRYARLVFECYEARPDGVGWDYHCMTSGPAAAAYVDVGAGRRPHQYGGDRTK